MEKTLCIRCEALSKLYIQGEKTIYAVNNCNIRIHIGEFNAIIGKSGSGKSTLLNLIAGYTTPTSGTVFILDKDIHQMNESQIAEVRTADFGFVFQAFNLLPILTAKENILFALRDDSQFSQNHFNELCKLLEIEDRLDHLPSELSGGQQQRVAIARALINKPRILLADEPTGNLDKASAENLIEYLKSIHQELRTTIVVATHDADLAASASRVFEIDNGVVKEI